MALDARTGRETAAGVTDCQGFTVHEKSGSVLCAPGEDGSVTVLDSASLRRKGSFGSGVTAGPAVTADGLVAVVSGLRVATYDLASGRERWHADSPAYLGEPGEVYFAGDRVLAVANEAVVTFPEGGPAAPDEVETFRPNLPDGFTARSAGDALAAGGAVFLALPDGLVVSGYLP
ncbi:hypothetical protein [Streptomyces sp. NPDC058583]|uniref:hypothetical protein n=1 Tax=unclassified Streptomyces TaxID=2593676 RepID=UPI00365F2E90